MARKAALAVASAVTASAFALPKLAKGEKYVGAIIRADGTGHHLVLLAGDKSGTWDEMMAWAKDQGGDLPDRVEQALLFRDHQAEFKKDWYWSNTPDAHGAGSAWCQLFSNGDQSSWHKSRRAGLARSAGCPSNHSHAQAPLLRT